MGSYCLLYVLILTVYSGSIAVSQEFYEGNNVINGAYLLLIRLDFVLECDAGIKL